MESVIKVYNSNIKKVYINGGLKWDFYQKLFGNKEEKVEELAIPKAYMKGKVVDITRKYQIQYSLKNDGRWLCY